MTLQEAEARRAMLFAKALDVIGRPSSVIPMSPRFLEWALEEEVEAKSKDAGDE